MASAVRDFKEIPLLFVKEGDEEVTGRRKTTAEVLDKIIQFIWDYKQRHNDETPAASVVERHVGGVGRGSIYYFMSMLVDEGRLNKISSKPFRVTISSHPKNASAIERFKRLLAKKEQVEAEERDRIRAEQEQTREVEQREADRQALFSATAVSDNANAEVAVKERPAPSTQDAIIPATERFLNAGREYRAASRDLKMDMPRLLKIADERDLVYELVSRGYTVARTR
jgi:hypothetical protein